MILINPSLPAAETASGFKGSDDDTAVLLSMLAPIWVESARTNNTNARQAALQNVGCHLHTPLDLFIQTRSCSRDYQPNFPNK